MADINDRVFYRQADSEAPISGSRVHGAMITKVLDEATVNLKVFPDMAPIFDMPAVILNSEDIDTGITAVWSPWKLD
jgi:hypothetical protein